MLFYFVCGCLFFRLLRGSPSHLNEFVPPKRVHMLYFPHGFIIWTFSSHTYLVSSKRPQDTPASAYDAFKHRSFIYDDAEEEEEGEENRDDQVCFLDTCFWSVLLGIFFLMGFIIGSFYDEICFVYFIVNLLTLLFCFSCRMPSVLARSDLTLWIPLTLWPLSPWSR